MGWNFAPEALGERIMADIIELVLAEKIKPVIGQVVGFDDIPAAITAMADRRTVGRTVVTVDP
jgi:NADPH2:quinone reductase